MSGAIDQFIQKMSGGDKHGLSIQEELEVTNLRRYAQGGIAYAHAMHRLEEAAAFTALLKLCESKNGFARIRRRWFNAHKGDAAALFGNTEGHGPLEKEIPIRIMVWWMTNQKH